jgi:hypothetical protein
VAVLVVILVFSIYRTVSGAAEGQQGRRRTLQAADDAAAAMSRDFTGLFAPDTGEVWAVSLRPDEDTNFTAEISFVTLLEVGPGEDPQWTRPVRATWRLERTNDAAWLTRTESAVRGPPSTNRAVHLRGLAAFRVALYDGAAWQDRWPGSAGGAAPPQAARVELRAAGVPPESGVELETWIPAGAIFTSRVIRAAIPAP